MSFEILAKIANFGKDKNGILEMPNFLRVTLYFDSVFHMLSGLRHRTDPIYNIWKSPLGGP